MTKMGYPEVLIECLLCHRMVLDRVPLEDDPDHTPDCPWVLAQASEYTEYPHYDLAETRVESTPQLEPYRDLLLADWPEGDEHYRSVATDPVDELIEWAKAIRAAEETDDE